MTTGDNDNPINRHLTGIDKTIHEPARLMIMANLYVVESADFTFLIGQTGLTWGNLSSHLSKLEKAGYVAVEKSFIGKKPHTMLHLTEDGRTAFQKYRQKMEQALAELPE
ncbi:MAG: transcriptional regulator [Chloroflexi bacterium]|nr:transcriptional regulator [Chloroflexota bacterium]